MRQAGERRFSAKRQHLLIHRRMAVKGSGHNDITIRAAGPSIHMPEPAWYRYFKSISAGTVGGIAVVFVGHPFDTLKVRMQTQPFENPIYSGLKDCFAKTMKWEGISGLYKGVSSPLVGQMFLRSCLFTSLFESQHFLAGPERLGKRLEPWEYFLSGAMTGFAASFVESPIDMFKSKMQIQIIKEKMGKPVDVSYRNVFHCASHIYRNYGVRGIFQGFPATICRNIPANAVYFGSFECLKDILTPSGGTVSDLSAFRIMLAGGTGGFLYWLATYNIDVVKSAMMADESDFSKRRYKNMLHCIKDLYRNEGGYTRLWRGFLPCALRSFPANATMLYVVDVVRNMFPPYKT